ncbi:MAG: hypothetical protein O3A14_17865 [Cyanobacteria bacterium]|nr:hypothetical protein [Cyanobacteriota bacterium]
MVWRSRENSGPKCDREGQPTTDTDKTCGERDENEIAVAATPPLPHPQGRQPNPAMDPVPESTCDIPVTFAPTAQRGFTKSHPIG